MRASAALASAASILLGPGPVSPLSPPADDGDEAAATATTNVGSKQKRCTFYLAKSTIEGAGMGVFTGVDLDEDAHIGFGDPAIPIIDIDFHAGGSKQQEDYHWLFTEYTWTSRTGGERFELEGEEVSAFASGIGSMPNCHFRLKNTGEHYNLYDTAGITRLDPGAGAFTYYHNRSTTTTVPMLAGQEIFVDYGTRWFATRENEGMGLVPLSDSYPRAARFMAAAKGLSTNLLANGTSTLSQDDGRDGAEEVMSDLWDLIVRHPYKSRPQSAIPKTFGIAKRAFEVGIQQTELEQSTRSLGDLEEHGRCLDILRPGVSSIPHAGRGAFATRDVPAGGYIAIAPLIHVPDRDVLTMYKDMRDPEADEEERDVSRPFSHQLLLNYCWGHESSSLLLCPYSSAVQYINHSSEPNAKIVWSTDTTFQNSSWLEEPVSFFDNKWHTHLSFEIIATEDIGEGNEVTIDYGAQWQDAWNEHVQRWHPPEGAERHVYLHQFDEDLTLPIPTDEEDNTLISETTEMWCHFLQSSMEMGNYVWREEDMSENEFRVQRVISRSEPTEDESHVYTVALTNNDSDYGDESEEYIVEGVPRAALSFHFPLEVQKYQSDLFINGVFRHEMMIPDDLFPTAWKNLV